MNSLTLAFYILLYRIQGENQIFPFSQCMYECIYVYVAVAPGAVVVGRMYSRCTTHPGRERDRLCPMSFYGFASSGVAWLGYEAVNICVELYWYSTFVWVWRLGVWKFACMRLTATTLTAYFLPFLYDFSISRTLMRELV